MRLDDISDCIELIDGAFSRNISQEDKIFESSDINKPPWSWFGQETVYFHVYKFSHKIIGYVVWRGKKSISHLHSFLISSEIQRMGIGSALLNEYEKGAVLLNSNCRLFTLHTYKDTEYNHKFYFSAGYVRYKKNDEKIIPSLHIWIDNCKKHNDWPLKNNKILFYKTV